MAASSSGGGYRRFLELPGEELLLLRERARELAKVVQPLQDDAQDAQGILEITSRSQTFAVPLSAVDGITDLVSLAPIPGAPPFARGLVSFHGEILIAIELSTLLGGPAVGFADLKRVIAVQTQSAKFAIVAERVISVRNASLSSFLADPVTQQAFVLGTDKGFVTLLDPAGLASYAFSLLEAAGK
jgi:chemotaxis signal transduction protein